MNRFIVLLICVKLRVRATAKRTERTNERTNEQAKQNWSAYENEAQNALAAQKDNATTISHHIDDDNDGSDRASRSV